MTFTRPASPANQSVALLLLVFLATLSAQGAELTKVELTPKQRVMPSLVNYYRPVRINLSQRPAEELEAEPEYTSPSPRYGAMKLGNGQDNTITIVVDEAEGQPERIYVDRNNDEDLTNDGLGSWSADSGSSLRLSNVEIQIPYASGPLPYTFEFYRFKTRLRDVVLYYRNAAREGVITSGGQNYRVAVLDENADGRFDDTAHGTLVIDLNQDGQLAGRSDSAEAHKLSEPFNIHGQVWEVFSLSPDGTTMTLRPSETHVEMKPYLQTGDTAPSFEAKDLNGETIRLVDEASQARYVLLDFWASWCGPCRREFGVLRDLHNRYKDQGLRLVGVNMDPERDKAVEAVQQESLEYAHVFDGRKWDSAVARLYRVRSIPQTYLLNADLQIVSKGLRGKALERHIDRLLGSDTNEPGPTPAPTRPSPVAALTKRPSMKLSPELRDRVQKRYDALGPAQLRQIALSETKLDGSNDDRNQLTPGTIGVVRTNEGRYAKFVIEEYGYTLTISWVTYDEDQTVHSQGSHLKIRGTWSHDFDAAEGGREPADVSWQQVNDVERYLVPQNGTHLAVVK